MKQTHLCPQVSIIYKTEMEAYGFAPSLKIVALNLTNQMCQLCSVNGRAHSVSMLAAFLYSF